MTTQMRHENARGNSGAGIWQSGWIFFAATMMIFGGVMAILEGVAAIRKDHVLVTTSQYTYHFDTTSWGWLHLALGIIIVLAGFSLFSGAVWARFLAVAIAGLSMIANFMWLPYYPLWAIVLIAIDAFVIWAVCTSGSHRARTR